ncbi:type VII secretion protein EssC, partial [Streptococcus caprae]
MVTLIIYSKGFRYELVLQAGKAVLVSQVFPGITDAITLTLSGEVVDFTFEGNQGQISSGIKLGDTRVYLQSQERRVYKLLQKNQLLLSDQVGADIQWPQYPCQFIIRKSQDQVWELQELSGQIYVDNILLTAPSVQLKLGSELAVEDKKIKFYGDELHIQGEARVSQELLEVAHSRYAFYADYPDYHRSPRIIYRPSEEKITLNAPSAEPKPPQGELLRTILPPLLMVTMTLVVTIFQPRGIYILVTVGMSIVSTIFAVQSYFKNRRKHKDEVADRIRSYKLYLVDKSMELSKLDKAQKEGQLYHYPSLETLDALTEQYDHRIYEKTPQHFDFLYYRLGLGQVPTSHQLSYSQTERSGVKDPLEVEGYTLYSDHLLIDDMPIVANLKHGPVGYIGPRDLVLEQLQLMVYQLSVFHSYHDVQFITILPEEEKDQWNWMRWLPHATLQEMNVRGFVYNQRTRDQVLNSLNQILKFRKAQIESKEVRESSLFRPHYVVLVTDEKLIMDHVIMEFFTEDPTELGCSLIFVEDVLSSLSENVKTIVTIKDRNTGQLVIEEGNLVEKDFRLDHFPADYDKESLPRRLAPLNHLENLKSSIPDVVTFMELYEAEDFEDLHVPQRWEKNAPYKSLAVPLGLRGQGDIVSLNLHEKAHGPHGLVAGTTGSGKSEIIQSYILSLAVNFHPHDVAFLLIDYKGGGMANLFKDLPHLLGTITNLDGAQSMRALVSINAELKRRQRLFSQYEVNHINQYQKKYKLGEVPEPMPHLFLISDEFAELKANQPEFMTELVSTARIGRSLGIHLILATQKPAGVVNDQ